MYHKKSFVVILFFLFFASNVLDARTNKRSSKAMDFLNNASKSNSYKSKRRKSSRNKKKSNIEKNITDEKKLQKSLVLLGFYHGAIDGEVNEFETRQAIRTMNQTYRNKDNSFLDSEVKNTLIYMADLYMYDRYLTSDKRDKKTKSIKLQTALKVFGFYSDEIDGLIKKETISSIIKYKKEKNLSEGKELDFEEKYQLISVAIELNQNNIKEAKESLKLPMKNKKIPVIDNEVKENSFSKEDILVPVIIEEETEGLGFTQEECLTLVASYDEAVLEANMEIFDDLESTANIIINMCDIKKTKTGDIAETVKRLKETK